VSFEAYHIPDKLTVKAGGSTIASTNQLVSGFHKFRLNVDPNSTGNTVDLYVDAPNDGTAWVLCADCEDSGTSCHNAIGREEVTAIVSWSTPYWTCNINSQRIDGVTYNGRAATTYLTPGQHLYEYDGSCACQVNLSCDIGSPKVTIGRRTYNLPTRWSPLYFDIN
jgi:hypothetical protein